jgi:hypothetical protein
VRKFAGTPPGRVGLPRKMLSGLSAV